MGGAVGDRPPPPAREAAIQRTLKLTIELLIASLRLALMSFACGLVGAVDAIEEMERYIALGFSQ